MTQPDTLHARIESAETSQAIASACWDAFEFIQRTGAGYATPGSDLFYTFLSIATVACRGRDTLGFAASMADGKPTAIPAYDPEIISADHAADQLAGLAGLIADKLRETSESITSAADHLACRDAAAAADEICELLAVP